MKKGIGAIILVAAVFACVAMSAGAATRTALIIGNGAYKSSPLKNPVNDARDIAGVLKQLGFEVILKTNSDKRSMLNAITQFGKRLLEAKVGLFFFAGHGMQVRGTNYMIPIGAYVTNETDVEIEGIDVRRILGRMESTSNDINIILLDACRDNPFKRSFRSSSNGLAKMDSPKGTFMAYATSPGNVAADGRGRNSPFTQHLLRNISEPDLPIEKLLKKVRKGVLAETEDKQMPWQTSSLTGDFYFNPQENMKTVSDLSQSTINVTTAKLYVKTEPENARIRILNIKPKFFQGIELSPGKYYIEASLSEYVTTRQWFSISPGEQKTIDVVLSRLQEGQEAAVSGQAQSAQNSAKEQEVSLETLLARAKLEKQNQEQKLEQEKKRKDELKRKIVLYEDLIKNYGDQYKDTAWKALCSDFPLLTAGLKPGDISALKQAASFYMAGDVWKDPVSGMEFVFVPPGCYQMGSNSGGEDEKPVHEVCLDGFWMGKYEVTQAQWQKVMGSNPSKFQSGEDFPVEQVSWNNAKKFILKINQHSGNTFKLPTEAQWEYAARSGGKGHTYAGGNDIDRVAWYSSNSGGKTHRVGTKVPNDLGIYDMSGNVWEWCEDVSDENAYSKHSRNNPVITSGGSSRVIRGGSWSDFPGYVRAANRNRVTAVNRFNDLGFRLCLSQVRQ
jgi:formylglycine-generating enzyme required for sulfatase activity